MLSTTPTLEELMALVDDDGDLNLSNTPITKLPDSLAVTGYLDLSYTPIAELPDGLTVGSYLDLSSTPITELPDDLTVGGYLDLSRTLITELPDGLTVGSYLDLNHTLITELPNGLTVGGGLDLSHTSITNLPDGLIVGGYIYADFTLPEYAKLQNGDYVEGRYLYVDDILAHVKAKRNFRAYTFYSGKIEGQNIVSDGTYYAHCDKMRDGILDLWFKAAKDRGANQYSAYTPDTVVPYEEAVTMYRIITGACRHGIQMFTDNLPEIKERYSIREIIQLTRGQYHAEMFSQFFE